MFLSFSLTGCGGGSDGKKDDKSSNYRVSFYDSVLDFNGSVEVNKSNPTINLSQVKDMLGITTPLYRALSSIDVSSETSYAITVNTNFYAAPDVIEITDHDGLNDIRDNLDGTYILLNDIPLDTGVDPNNGWDPIGNDSNPFTGIFSGNGNTISNLWINRTTTDNVGLFGIIENSQIKNIGVEIPNDKEMKGKDNVGGIAGWVRSSSIISNSYSIGSVSGTYSIGGIVGYIIGSSNITNSYSTANVNGSQLVGGIAGSLYASSIRNSYLIGTISGNSNYVGGIAGSLYSSSITNSYSMGTISGTGNYVGGIAGIVHGYSSITNNAAINPSVTGTSNVNRVAGFVEDSTVENNFALDSMVVSSYLSGNAGTDKNETDLKTQSTYSDTVSGDGNGGLGWSFDGDNDSNPWKIDSDEVKNNGYPYLYWQDL
ncbi:MAG: hypothetical protein LBF71_03180 [Campylobacteraceae bacterium]|nr:hypothetical protein [Campylobacteraceae bacterium]